jgi:hypothetical protein
MASLNRLVKNYTRLLQQGELQTAYKGILEFILKLRSEITQKHPEYGVGGLYQGYLDMTYFPLAPKKLKERGLKIAVVYLHEKGAFEVWLSARNRDTAKRYGSVLNSNISDNITVFHDDNNQDAIIESILTSTPNFDEQASLIEIVEQGVDKFVIAINSHL